MAAANHAEKLSVSLEARWPPGGCNGATDDAAVCPPAASALTPNRRGGKGERLEIVEPS